MSDEQDRRVQEAAQHALDEIARIHDHAVSAVWEQYPAPTRQPRRSVADPANLGRSK